jgi:hypothetical protein
MRNGFRVVTVMLWLGCLLGLSVSASAQSATSSLRGTITDSKGLVVAGATATLTNGATGFSRSTTTNDQGVYQFLEVPPADYVLTVTAAGFATTKRENVLLQVSSPATVNLTLQVQGGSVIVDVSGEAPMVNTVDASLGNNFNARQLTDLPSEGRDPVAILSLQPGVTYIGNTTNDQQMSDSRGGAVNGARSDQTNITLDGLDDNDQLEGFAFEGAMRTTLDSLQEFRVTTGNYDAGSGRSSGAQVNLVTKSGTNKIHGSIYEVYRPSFDVANDWFNKQSELANNQPNVPGFILRNTFGATIGGPIKKDRLFFFMAYEGQRTSDATQVTREIPTPSLIQGYLRYLCDPGSDPNCKTTNSTINVVPGGNAFAGFNIATLSPDQVAALDQGCMGNGTCPGTPGNPAGPGDNGKIVNITDAAYPNGANPSALFTNYPVPNSSSEGDLLNTAAYTFPGADPVKHDTYIVKLDYKINASGSHALFVRANLQNDHEKQPPQFPGQPPFDFLTNNSKGIAAGYTALISNNVINNLRYAFIRQGLGTGGINNQDFVNFRGLDDTQGLGSQTILTNVPVHNIVDDVSWTKGKHTLQFGTNWRVIHNNRQSNADNISFAQTNLYWLNPSFIANEGISLDPSIMDSFQTVPGPYPDVSSSFGTSYSFAAMDAAGILSETFTQANQNRLGQQIPNGQLVQRHFQNYEGELYLQDKWNVTPNLVVTYGARYSLLQPPFESKGNQVSPTVDMDQWFKTRGYQASLGHVVQPDLTFGLSGQANGGKPYWAWDYKNIAPRLAIAYSPHSASGLWHMLFGDAGKSSIRAGFGIYFDHFGEGVVNTFDRNGSWGLTSTFSNPAGVSTVDNSPRYTGLLGLGNLPAGEISPSPSGFPYAPPNNPNTYGLAIAWGIDDHLRTPYSEVADFSITREFKHNFVLETTYTGRFARHLLQEVDLAQPLNLLDPKSGMTYFQAAQKFAIASEQGVPGSNAGLSESDPSVTSIPYWQDMFPQAAGPAGEYGCTPGIPANPTATQNMYDLYQCFAGNETTAQEIADVFCFPACAGTGPGGAFYGPGTPYQYYQDQFSSLYAWQTRSNSNYNALQVTVRHAMSAGLQFDLNYVYSKSIDISSNAERVNGFEAAGGVAYNNQAINAWAPDLWRAVSDFDTTHQMNFNFIWDLPYGKGRHWNSSNRFMNSVFGGWGLSGLGRWTSGFPFSVSAGAGWATNFELEGTSVLVGPKPKTGVYIDSSGNPNVFKNAQNIQCICPYAPDPANGPILFRDTYPGEAGQRNIFRGPGFFDIDSGLSKNWAFSENRLIRLSWEVFNVTNSVRFDAANAVDNEDLVDITGFGKFQRTLTTPRVMQFSLRFAF